MRMMFSQDGAAHSQAARLLTDEVTGTIVAVNVVRLRRDNA